jgi:succinoglycan biosynthesis protein ExoA
MRPSPRVSVVLPCRNEASCIDTCIRTLLAQKQPVGGMEVVVADGMSDDDTREILQRLAAQYPIIKIVDNPGKTTACGLNVAILAAQGEIIVRVDAHTEYASDYVVQCVEVLERTGADNVGGPARTKAVSFVQRAVAAAYHTPCVVGGSRFHDVDYEGDVDTVTYGCWRRSGFDRFGLFDEGLVRNQDDEHNLRIVRSGGRIWQSPQIRSWYMPRSSLTLLWRQYFQYGYWKARVIQKHRQAASIRHLIPGLFVLSLIWVALVCPFTHRAEWFLGLELLAYGCFVLLASCMTACQHGWGLLPILPVVIVVYQISYGLGFLLGVLDFWILHHRGRFMRITRDGVPSSG